MHIVLDLQARQSPESGRRGIGRYSLSLAKAVAKHSRGHRVTLLLNSAMSGSIEPLRAQFDPLLSQRDIVVWKGLRYCGYVHPENTFRRRASELLRTEALRSLKPDMVHIASVFEGFSDDVVSTISRQDPYLTAVTLYDLIPLVHKDTYLADQGIGKWYMQKLEHFRNANQMLGISRFSCEEAMQLLSVERERITDISGAVDDIFVPLANPSSFRAELMGRYGIRRPFVMYAGGFDSRKNIGALIRAFAKLPAALRREHQLVIVGGAPEPEKKELERITRRSGLISEDVVLTGFVPDSDLVKLYNLCALYAFPSLQEGFGLPALEAMSSGAVVVGSRTSSLPEVIGMDQALFDPHDDADICAKMAMALSDADFRGRFLEHARRQVLRFSWTESARRAIDAMEMAFERDKAPPITVSPVTNVADQRTAFLPAPGSVLHLPAQGAVTFGDACTGAENRLTSAVWEAEHAQLDRLIVEVTDHAYCAKTVNLALSVPADTIIGSPRIGRTWHALATINRGLLVETLYRYGGYPLVREALEADFEAEALGRLLPPSALDLLGANQVTATIDPISGDTAHVEGWRDRTTAFVTNLLQDREIVGQASDHDWADVASSLTANAPRSDRPRHWFVDISSLAARDAGTGIQRVVRHILDELMKSPPSGCRVEPVSIGDDGVIRYARCYATRRYFSEEKLPGDEVVQFVAGDIYLGLDLSAHLIPTFVENFRALRDLGVQQYFVVYDLLPLLRPDCFDPPLVSFLRSWYEAIAEVSDGVLCISRAVADEFESWLHQSRPRRHRPLMIGWFHLGADLVMATRTETEGIVAVPSLEALGDRPTFLMVGTVEPRKGHAQTLAAFEMLWQQGVEANLVIVGKAGWLVDDLVQRLRQHPMRGRRLFWFENAGDDLLLDAYQRASALLMASEGEGYGLPLIEAARYSLPLIVRDIPVFREIVGEHAHYFVGYGASDLSETIQSWLSLSALGTVPASTAIPWLSWEESKIQLVDVVTKQAWVHHWVQRDALRFAASDYRLQSQVGRLVRSQIETTGIPGVLMHGPYVALAAGGYTVEVKGEGRGRGRLDVCSNKGLDLHGGVDFEIAGNDGIDASLARVDFVLVNDVQDLEIRLVVGEESDFRLSCVEIHPAVPADIPQADVASCSGR